MDADDWGDVPDVEGTDMDDLDDLPPLAEAPEPEHVVLADYYGETRQDFAKDEADGPFEFTESPEGYDARERWAHAYDDLNGAPEGDEDR